MASPTDSVSGSPSVASAAEQRARQFLAEGRWRKARDEFKPLVKADRERFLPLLIEANIGLVREMVAKGQISEARQVIDYLATIASPDQLIALKLDLTSNRAPGNGASDLPPPLQALEECFLLLAGPNADLLEGERQRLADILVLAFQPLTGNGEAATRLAAEVAAVQEALRLVSERAWDRVSEVLRAVPSRSPVRHWVILIKGMAAFYAGDETRAEACFQGLTGQSVPARAAETFRFLRGESMAGAKGAAAPEAELGNRKGLERTESILGRVVRLMGVGVASGMSGGASLLRADREWREGRPVESYGVLRASIPEFPSDGTDVLGALSEFYFLAPTGLSESVRRGYERHFEGLLNGRKHKPGAERMLALRLLALAQGRVVGADVLQERWEGYLAERTARRGFNPRFASLADTWLGQKLAPNPSRGRRSGRARRPLCDCPDCLAEYGDPEDAVAALKRAIARDAENRSAYLALTNVYDSMGNTSDRNRLLDVMVVQFPEDKEVLLTAAQACLDRRAFGKGLDYLARARVVDPLDPSLPELEASAERRLARQYFQQRKPEKGRQVLARLEPSLNSTPQDYVRSRWAARLNQGLMEKFWGDPSRADPLLAEAQAAAPRLDVFLLFAHLASRAYMGARGSQSPYRSAWQQEMGRKPTVSGIAVMLGLLEHWRNAPERLSVEGEEAMTIRAMQIAAREPYTRAEAIDAIERARRVDYGQLGREIRPIIKAVLRKDPADPRFRLYAAEFDETAESGAERQVVFQAIIEEAMRRQDDVAVQRAREELRKSNRNAHLPWDDDFGAEDDGDWDDEEEEEDDSWAVKDPSGKLLPDLDAAGVSGIEMLFETLRAAPDQVIRLLRSTRPKKISGELFDELVRMAKSGRPPSDFGIPQSPPSARDSSRGAAAGPARPARPDPGTTSGGSGQMNLF